MTKRNIYSNLEGAYRKSKIAWTSVLMLSLAYMVSFMDRQILVLLVEPMKQDLQITDTQVILLTGFALAVAYAKLLFWYPHKVSQLYKIKGENHIKEWKVNLLYKWTLLISCLMGSVVVSSSESYSPKTAVELRSVYWGDTHLHSSLSNDANSWGQNKKLTPEYAYRFARGELVVAHNGMRAQLKRPLDFLVLADHAEGLGYMSLLEARDSRFISTEDGAGFFERFKVFKAENDVAKRGKARHALTMDLWRYQPEKGDQNFSLRSSFWDQVVANAERYNLPGTFTAFVGYEWTSMPSGGNLHRVVVYADGADKATQFLPFTSMDSENPEELWGYMQRYTEQTGGDVLAIPHNGNLSYGKMFDDVSFSGQAINKNYAEIRSRWEPLYEVTQIKGDSEAHPLLSPDDAFADFETWNDWGGAFDDWGDEDQILEQKDKEYARSTLMRGLKFKSQLGVNPYKFGLIGSTDAHNSFATADENNFWGKASLHEPNDQRLFSEISRGWPASTWKFAASGYTAIWAEENTRESLFAAMKRKEVYASTGPRITVRFFGGWDYQQNDAYKPDLARIGYEKGVPMGGDLTAAPESKAPRFLIRAVKDPDGANLDRVQVIKGWHDANGDLHEKIYNVALSDGRKESWRGKVKPVGNTVDIPDASYTNTIGDPELAVVWTDPDFDKDELAFYYLRVLEIPTPRWTAYDAKYFKLKDIPEEVPMITQERAYTSPIWYTPATE